LYTSQRFNKPQWSAYDHEKTEGRAGPELFNVLFHDEYPVMKADRRSKMIRKDSENRSRFSA
jgi:hypothetical protein